MAGKVYKVVESLDGSDAVELTDFCFPWLDLKAPDTVFRAWHGDGNLYFDFLVEDTDIVLNDSASDDEKVLGSDRVELFFAQDKELANPYYGFEIDPRGLVYDYRAEFHRKFDPTWKLDSLEIFSEIFENGYRVNGAFPLTDLKDSGCLSDSGEIVAGVYRAEFSHNADGSINEDWISWIDPDTSKIDFHVPETFGLFQLT